MTDRESLLRMLRKAGTAHAYQRVEIAERPGTVILWTGPDDAGAVFGFDSDGSLQWVSVVEAHGNMEYHD